MTSQRQATTLHAKPRYNTRRQATALYAKSRHVKLWHGMAQHATLCQAKLLHNTIRQTMSSYGTSCYATKQPYQCIRASEVACGYVREEAVSLVVHEGKVSIEWEKYIWAWV